MEIRTSALIGLGALGILFGAPMEEHAAPGSFTVIAGEDRIRRYKPAAHPLQRQGMPV